MIVSSTHNHTSCIVTCVQINKLFISKEKRKLRDRNIEFYLGFLMRGIVTGAFVQDYVYIVDEIRFMFFPNDGGTLAMTGARNV